MRKKVYCHPLMYCYLIWRSLWTLLRILMAINFIARIQVFPTLYNIAAIYKMNMVTTTKTKLLLGIFIILHLLMRTLRIRTSENSLLNLTAPLATDSDWIRHFAFSTFQLHSVMRDPSVHCY